MIVLDASVVVELLTNGTLADAIRNELAARDESFLVPHLIDVEVIGAIRRLVSGQRIDSHRSQESEELSPGHKFPLIARD